MGFAGANNVGVKHATGKYLLLINTDAYLDTDSLEKLAKVIHDHPEYHYMQIDEKKYDKTDLPDRYLIFSMDIFGYPIGTNGKGPLFYADGAGLVITRDLFMKLGGFDKKYYMYLEEVDLAWRARMAGEQIYFLKGIYVYHYMGGTSITTHSKGRTYTTTINRRFHAQKNNLRSLLKNYSLVNLLWAFPISVILASIEGTLYLFQGNIPGFLALHKAIIWNFLNLADTLKERKIAQSLRKVPDKEVMKFMEKKISKYYSFLSHGVPRLKM